MSGKFERAEAVSMITDQRVLPCHAEVVGLFGVTL